MNTPGTPITPLELERIKLLYAQGLSENAIAGKIHRSRTLVHAALLNHGNDIMMFKEAVLVEKADVYTGLITKGLGIIDDKMNKNAKDISAVAAAKIVGILFDKRQLLIGEPTSIEDNNVSLEQRNEATRIIEALGEFAEASSDGSAEKDSGEEPILVRPALLTAPSDEEDE